MQPVLINIRPRVPYTRTRRREGALSARGSHVPQARLRRGEFNARSRTPAPTGVANVRARWSFDCTYGNKMQAIELLQEWVQEVGAYADPYVRREVPFSVRLPSVDELVPVSLLFSSLAHVFTNSLLLRIGRPLNEANTSMSAGNIGAPESKLELEVAFESLDALERFWGSIDPSRHMEWGEKVKGVVIDGSPRWEVWRGVDPWAQGSGMSAAVASSRSPKPAAASSPSVLEMASWDDMDRYAGKNWGSTFEDAKELLGGGEGAGEEIVGNGSMAMDGTQKDKGKPVFKDWKGDPMVINPGDKLPFRFD